ncbi:MAG: type II CRISPR-associated endonuclease Cas1 [Bacillota bacterium]|nr:type II CRISPR-associated endonuclease Cas1 [Bacillota bacterium]
MSWRTVVISRRAKLDLCLNYLEVRGEEVKKVHLSEIGTLIIESTAVSLTAALLCELVNRKVKVIFCDAKRNPLSELLPYYGSFDTSAKVRQQLTWDKDTKALIWGEIVTEKIRQQQALLAHLGQTERADLLLGYAREVAPQDATNREGHAAKVYFGGLFGLDFSRAEENTVNAALNYGYSILLSAFNREIVAQGYLTQLGIFHDNMFNQFNLGSDFMEPFRPLVDRIVYEALPFEFEREMRLKLVGVLDEKVRIDNQSQYVANAIRIYTRSLLDALNQKSAEEIKFFQTDLLGPPAELLLRAREQSLTPLPF